MTNEAETKLDKVLEELARDVREATPRPSTDLVARVLADAAAITSASRSAERRMASATAATPKMQLSGLLFGWASGAVAAMTLALIIGMGVGLQIDPDTLPLIEPPDDGIIVMADGAMMPEEFL